LAQILLWSKKMRQTGTNKQAHLLIFIIFFHVIATEIHDTKKKFHPDRNAQR